MEQILNGNWKIHFTDGQRGGMPHCIKEDGNLLDADLKGIQKTISDDYDDVKWIDAVVPGEIHLDLLRAGIIDDPYVGINALKCRWVEEMMWYYRRVFDASEAAEASYAFLRFEGLDYGAVIYLNGQEIARHANSFYPLSVDVSGKLKKQGNVLPFFQHLLIQNLFHAGFTEKDSMSENLKRDFISILEGIEDDILCGCEQIPDDVKIWLLEAKKQKPISPELVYRSGRLRYHNLTITSLKEMPYEIKSIVYRKKKLVVSGEVIQPAEDAEIVYYAMDNRNKEIPFSVTEKEVYYLGEKKHTRKFFKAEIPVSAKPVGLRFMYRYHELYRARVRMAFAGELKLVPETKDDYAFLDQLMLRTEKRILFAAPLQKKTRIKQFFTFGRKSIKIETGLQQ